MAINTNELILERVRELIFTDLTDGSVIGRLTSLEEPALNITAEGENLTDAFGAVVDTIYKSKMAEFTASNSFFSLNLAAIQFGTAKEVAAENTKVPVPASEILTVDGTTVTLSHEPCNQVKYIYKLENKSLMEKYEVAEAASERQFSIDGAVITVPTGTTGSIYVEYEYMSATAARVINNTENFPEAVGCKIFCVFKDPCNTNIKYAGTIVAKRAKLDPSSIEMALTAPGKHSFTVKFNKNYCEESADLFSIIIDE